MKKEWLLIAVLAVVLTGCSEKNDIPASSVVELNNIETSDEAAPKNNETKNTSPDLPVKNTSEIKTESDNTNTDSEISEISEIPDDGQLVRILEYIPDAEIDLRYATADNFTGSVIYDDPEAYLCYGTVKKLMSVQNELKEKGYRILIWDAYRSHEAQWKLWETYPDPMFVADPNYGISGHSLGNTIDISIVHLDGTPVEMPSGFDEFSSIADRDYSDVSETAAANSRLLEDVMYRNGFTGYSGEWWDYSDTQEFN